MKNLFVRAFVAALVLTGTVATARTASAGAPVVRATASAVPVPTCPPDDPNGCNIKTATGGK